LDPNQSGISVGALDMVENGRREKKEEKKIKKI